MECHRGTLPDVAPTLRPTFYACLRYLRRCVLERLLGVPGLVNFYHQRDRDFVVVGIRLTYVFPRDAIQQLEIGVGAVLNDSAAKLRLAVRVLEVKDGNGNPRVTHSSTLVLPIFHLNEREIANSYVILSNRRPASPPSR